MEGLDNLFKYFYYLICDIAKWIFAIRMATNILKSSESADIQGMIRILIAGGASYGALYMVVNILDSVKAAL